MGLGEEFWGSENEGQTQMIIDNQENLYVIGTFQSELDFGDFILTPGLQSEFVVKFNSEGEAIWGKSFGSWELNSFAFISSVAVDSENNVYISGYFTGSLTFANTTVETDNWMFYFAKYDSIGNELWIITSDASESKIQVDSEDNIIVAGIFQGQVSFDSVVLTSNGSTDIFTAKFDEDGNLIWAKNFGGDDWESLQDMTIDSNDNIILLGSFYSDSITFGSTTLNGYNTDPVYPDLFLVKYSSTGEELWGEIAGAEASYVYGANILIDNEQDVFITGSFKGTLIFQHLTLSSSLDWLSFIFKLNRNGNVEWGKNLFGNHDIIMDLVKTDVEIYVYGV